MPIAIESLEKAVQALREDPSIPIRPVEFADRPEPLAEADIDLAEWIEAKLKSAVALADRISGCGGQAIKSFAVGLGERVIDEIQDKDDQYIVDYFGGIRAAQGLCINATRQSRYFPATSFYKNRLHEYPELDEITLLDLEEAWDRNTNAICPKRANGETGLVPIVGVRGDVVGSRPNGVIKDACVVVGTYGLFEEPKAVHAIDVVDPSKPVVIIADVNGFGRTGFFSKARRRRSGDIYAIYIDADDIQVLGRSLRDRKMAGIDYASFDSSIVVNDSGAYLFDYPVAEIPFRHNGYCLPFEYNDPRWAVIEPIYRQRQSMQAHGYIDDQGIKRAVAAITPVLSGVDGAEAYGARACIEQFQKCNWIGGERYAPFHMIERCLRQVPDALMQCSLPNAPGLHSPGVSFDICDQFPPATRGEPSQAANKVEGLVSDTGFVERILDVALAPLPLKAEAQPSDFRTRFTLTAIIRLLMSETVGKTAPVKLERAAPVNLKVDVGGLRLLSRDSISVEVPEDEDSVPAAFLLEMTSQHDCWITLSVYQNGKFIDQIKFGESDFLGANRQYPLKPGAEVDLVLHVRDDHSVEADSPSSVCNLSGYKLGPLRPTNREILDKLRRKLVDLQCQEAAPEKIDTELQVIGSQLADAVPIGLMQLLKEGQLKAIFLRHGVDFDFPFELVLVEDKKDYFFVGDRISVCRWYLNVDTAPPQNRKMIDRAAVLAGDTSFAQSDYELISRNCSTQSFEEAEIVYQNVFSSSSFKLLHFIGHCDGTNVADPALVLKNGRIELDRIYRAPAEKAFAAAQPIVVLNGCVTANPYVGLLGRQSFAYRFLRANASIFVGTLWPVHESVAHEFTCTFYAKMAGGISLGEALLQTKREIAGREIGTDGKRVSDGERILRRISARSYSAFGHPNFGFGFSAT